MRDIKAYGKFVKKDGFIYRTNTYLQFGESDRVIGACILCNPGSSSLLDKKKEEELLNYQGESQYEVKGELKLDPTMSQLKDIFLKTYDNELEGRLKIFNVFTIRNAKMSEAKKLLVNEWVDNDLLFQDFNKYKDQYTNKSFLHTLIGWGCDDFSALKREKKRWLAFINDNNVTQVGIDHANSPHYYHPLPQLVEKRIDYKNEICKQYISILKENKMS